MKTKAIHFHEQADGSLVCPHRDLSTCEECFAATPNLVDVYSKVYRWEPSAWSVRDAFDIAAGRTPYARLSPGSEV